MVAKGFHVAKELLAYAGKGASRMATAPAEGRAAPEVNDGIGTREEAEPKGLAEREGFEPSVQVLARTTV